MSYISLILVYALIIPYYALAVSAILIHFLQPLAADDALGTKPLNSNIPFLAAASS